MCIQETKEIARQIPTHMKSNDKHENTIDKKLDGANCIKNNDNELTYLSIELWWGKWPQGGILGEVDGEYIVICDDTMFSMMQTFYIYSFA
jgi:hypothetical protein